MLWHILFFFYHLLGVAYISKGNYFEHWLFSGGFLLQYMFLIPAFICNKTRGWTLWLSPLLLSVSVIRMFLMTSFQFGGRGQGGQLWIASWVCNIGSWRERAGDCCQVSKVFAFMVHQAKKSFSCSINPAKQPNETLALFHGAVYGKCGAAASGNFHRHVHMLPYTRKIKGGGRLQLLEQRLLVQIQSPAMRDTKRPCLISLEGKTRWKSWSRRTLSSAYGKTDRHNAVWFATQTEQLTAN